MSKGTICWSRNYWNSSGNCCVQVKWWFLLKKLLDYNIMRIKDGQFTNLSLWSQDEARVWKSDHHSSETVKLRRKKRRHKRKGYENTQKENEGETYSSGNFWVCLQFDGACISCTEIFTFCFCSLGKFCMHNVLWSICSM